MPLLDHFRPPLYPQHRFESAPPAGVGTSTIGKLNRARTTVILVVVTAGILIYIVSGIGWVFWQINAKKAASQRLAETLREKYPKLEIRGGSGKEHIGIQVIGISDDKVQREIMDWLRKQTDEQHLAHIGLDLDDRGFYWLDDTTEQRWRKTH